MSFAICPSCGRPTRVEDLRVLKNGTGKTFKSKKCKGCQDILINEKPRKRQIPILATWHEVTEEGVFTVVRLSPGGDIMDVIKEMNA